MYHKNRRDSRSPRLQRQATAIDESVPPLPGRRGSQPTLTADDCSGHKARRDSLSPDSAGRAGGKGRRDSRSRLSPDRSNTERDVSPVGNRRGRFRIKFDFSYWNHAGNNNKNGSRLNQVNISRTLAKTINLDSRRLPCTRGWALGTQVPRKLEHLLIERSISLCTTSTAPYSRAGNP